MPKGEDITTRFKVDTSDLKKGITEANNQIKLANSEFKKASAGMDDWAKSSDGIRSKLDQLKSVLEAQNSKLQIYQQQLQSAQKYEREASNEVTRLKQALEQAKSAYGSNSTEVKKLQTQLTQAEKAEMSMKNQVTALSVTMNNQEASVNRTEKEMNDLKSSLNKVEQAEKTAAQTGKSVDDVLKEMDESARNAGGGFTVLKGTLANLVADGIRTAINGIKSLVGEAIDASDALYKFEQTMGFAGYDNASIQKAKAEMKQYADETVYDLNTISNTTAQLAANGIQDYTGLTQAAGNLNAVAGGNADTFKSVALVLTQTAGAGKLTTENWNQLANAIPGASGKLQEALLKNGAYTGNFREAMEKGEITAEEFNKAIMQLGNEPVAVEAAKSVETFEGAVGNMQAAVVDGLMKIIDAIGMENITGFINSATNGIQNLIPIVQKIVNVVIQNGSTVLSVITGIGTAMATYFVATKIITFTTAIKGMITAFTTAPTVIAGVKAAMAALNITLAANPIGLVVAAIAGLVAAFVVLWNKSEAFRNFWIGLWEAIKSAAQLVIDGLVQMFTTAWDSIKIVWDVVQPYFEALWKAIKKIFSVAKDVLGGYFELAWKAIKVVWDAATGYFKAVWETIKKIFSVVKSVLTGDFQGAWDGIKDIVGTWTSYFSGVWNGIKNVWDGTKSFFSGIWSTVSNGTKTAWNGIKSTISNVLSGIKTTVSDTISKIKDTVKNIFNGIKPKLSLSLPKITVNGGEAPYGIGGKGKLPSFKITWNRLGGVFDSPTIFGGSKGFQGLGEDGAEAVVPLERNKYWIGKVADEMLKQLQSSNTNNAINNLTNNNTNNFTQVINAPKSPSRIELYRQTKNLLALKGGV